jgi:hypothetical protein
MAVSFYVPSFKRPDKGDFKKLGRVMKYLWGTLDIDLTLKCNYPQIIKWWVDVSFTCHDDMRSHTRGVMNLGTEAAYATPT